MYSKILSLRFPVTEVQKPLVCILARDFNLTFNILHATILPRKEGIMVLELSGAKQQFKQGVQYLKEHGVRVQNASQEISRNDEKCIHCGACTAVCPTSALSISRPDMHVLFEQKKCSVCELCITTCLTHAMQSQPKSEAFFE